MSSHHIATLGGGCFWCLDATLGQLKGVNSVVSGYMGGQINHPTYHEVCAGTTGHAEVVQISFDPEILSYADLLRAFFVIHDPTTLNRQGHDVGTQYRSVIFMHDAEQATQARNLIRALDAANIWPGKIVTQIVEASGPDAPPFWPAESYHQDYFANNPDQPYCQAVVAPKLGKLRKVLADRLR